MKNRISAFAVCIILILSCLCSCAKPTGVEVEDLSNMKITLITGSESISIATKYVEEAGCKLVGAETAPEILYSLTEGDSDCAILDRNIAEKFIEENPGFCISESVVAKGGTKLTTLKSKKVYSIMVEKALKALKEDGTIDEIVNNYLSDPEYKYPLSQEHDNSNGEFIIALDTFFAPYSQDDGVNVTGGINVAIIDAMCTYLKCDYSVIPVTTSSLANALRMGKADIAIGAFDNMEQYFPNDPLEDSETVYEYDYVIVSKQAK